MKTILTIRRSADILVRSNSGPSRRPRTRWNRGTPLRTGMSALQIVLLTVLAVAQLLGAEKTDLAKEIYVESSETDFALTVQLNAPADGKTRMFEVTAPQSGTYTLLCFVDKQFWTRSAIGLPGKYSLNVRGLAPGTHKVTIQVVDKNGRVGSSSHSIVKDK